MEVRGIIMIRQRLLDLCIHHSAPSPRELGYCTGPPKALLQCVQRVLLRKV